MSNYKKDKSYIKQRLEYVSPVDYISELEEKIEYLEYLKNENERLNNIIDELEKYLTRFDFEVYTCKGRQNGKSIELGARLNNDMILDKLKELKESE